MKAQAQLVLDCVETGKPLLPITTQFALKMRKLGPLVQEWATGNTATMPDTPHTRFWSLMSLFVANPSGQGTCIR